MSVFDINGDSEQFNGREGETATFLSTFVLYFGWRVIGFAPRHLSRWAAVLICVGTFVETNLFFRA